MKYFFISLLLLWSIQPATASIHNFAIDSTEITVLFFGDSITAGNGIAKEKAFPALIQQKIDSLNVNATVINGGLSGETSAGGVRRVDWLLQKPVDILILELGGNDGLRGIDPAETKKNLATIIRKARDKYPRIKIILAGMQVPPNLGTTYTEKFKAIYPALAREFNVNLIPFILKDVAGVDSLNQEDGIHPTEEGHAIIADTVWEPLKALLKGNNRTKL